MVTMQKNIQKSWEVFEYKHTSITIVIMLLTLLALNTALGAVVLEWFKSIGLIGGLIGGAMSVSMFTTAPALILIVEVAQHTNPVHLVIVASIGSIIGDWLIIKFLEDEVAKEIKPILKKFHILQYIRRFQRSKSRWLATVLGSILLALPLPDEFGIALMDISNIKRRHLLTICFMLNFIGLIGLVAGSRAFF